MKPDIMAPFDDNYTREESILIQFENCLFAYNYAIMSYMLNENTEYWCKILPGLKHYDELIKDPSLPKDQVESYIYGSSFLYTSKDLISKLSNNTLTYEEGQEILHLIDDLIPYQNYGAYITTLGMGLRKIIDSKKIKKIRIYSNHFNERKLFMLGEIFEGTETGNKAVAYEEKEGIGKCLKDNWNELTTVFMEDVEEFYDLIMDEHDPSTRNTNLSLEEKCIFLPQGEFNLVEVCDMSIPEEVLEENPNMTPEEYYKDELLPLKYQNIFTKIEEDEKCQINMFNVII